MSKFCVFSAEFAEFRRKNSLTKIDPVCGKPVLSEVFNGNDFRAVKAETCPSFAAAAAAEGRTRDFGCPAAPDRVVRFADPA